MKRGSYPPIEADEKRGQKARRPKLNRLQGIPVPYIWWCSGGNKRYESPPLNFGRIPAPEEVRLFSGRTTLRFRSILHDNGSRHKEKFTKDPLRSLDFNLLLQSDFHRLRSC